MRPAASHTHIRSPRMPWAIAACVRDDRALRAAAEPRHERSPSHGVTSSAVALSARTAHLSQWGRESVTLSARLLAAPLRQASLSQQPPRAVARRDPQPRACLAAAPCLAAIRERHDGKRVVEPRTALEGLAELLGVLGEGAARAGMRAGEAPTAADLDVYLGRLIAEAKALRVEWRRKA